MKIDWDGSRRMVLACALLMAFAAAPLHAQFTYTDLFDFDMPGGIDPADRGQLTLLSNGNLYGTAYEGGADGCGTIFGFAVSSDTYNDVYDFTSSRAPEQCFPVTALTPAVDQKTSVTYLYGSTRTLSGGGLSGPPGTLFRYDPTGGTMKILHSFRYPAEVSNPPVVGFDGNLYGLSDESGVPSKAGVAFKINPASGAYTQLTNTAPDGSNGPLFLASDLDMYGVTCSTVVSSQNTVFSMTTAGVINTFYTFSSIDCPSGSLTQPHGSSGNLLYGVASTGGANGAGYIFEVATDGTGFTDLHDFAACPINGCTNADGASPRAGLLAAVDGNLYGTAAFGGANGDGTIFELTPTATGWSFTKLFDFSGTGGTVLGAEPLTTLWEHPDGSFYGLTYNGGANNSGVIYKVTPFNPILTVTLCCNPAVILDQPVQIYGVNLYEVIGVTFGGASAQFQSISPTYLTAQVPAAAVDGEVVVTAINPASGQEETFSSQQSLHILPTITNLEPRHGAVGSQVLIEGGGFANASEVAFGGVPATSFSVQAPNVIAATVPTGAQTGKVTVTTPNGTTKSKQTFTVN